MKGLIIDEPWIGLIFSGRKTWEMRKTACHHRGRIALIRKGSGQVVGTADVVDSLPSLDSMSDYARAEAQHRIPPARQQQAFADGWRTPWVLADVRQMLQAISYRHPSGAVIWVNLETDVAAAVAAQESPSAVRENPAVESRVEQSPPHASVPNVPQRKIAAASPGTGRTVTVTGGNLRNNHLYLPLDFFPQDAIGGSNKSESAAQTITVTFIPGTAVETDIDRTKRILRARGAVADFFACSGLREGDEVSIVNTAPYKYQIMKATNA